MSISGTVRKTILFCTFVITQKGERGSAYQFVKYYPQNVVEPMK